MQNNIFKWGYWEVQAAKGHKVTLRGNKNFLYLRYVSCFTTNIISVKAH